MGSVPDPAFILTGSHSPITALSILNQSLISAEENGTICSWSLVSNRCELRFKAHDQSVLSLHVTKCGNVVSVGRDGAAIFWHPQPHTWKKLDRVSCRELSYCPGSYLEMDKESLLAVAGEQPESSVIVYSISDLEEINVRQSKVLSIEGESKFGLVMSLCSTNFSTSCPKCTGDAGVITGYENGYIVMWQYSTGKRSRLQLDDSVNPVTCLSFCERKQLGVAGLAQPVIKVFRSSHPSSCVCTTPPELTILHTLALPGEGPRSLVCSATNRPDERLSALGCSWDGRVRILCLKRLKLLASLTYHSAGSVVLCYTKSFLFVGGTDKLISAWKIY